MKGPNGEPQVVVLDSHDSAPWDTVQKILTQRDGYKRPLRWIAGPKTAWELCGDLETFLSLEPIGMGPLTAFELDSWAAKYRMGDRSSALPPGSAIPDADKAAIISKTGGLLPILEGCAGGITAVRLIPSRASISIACLPISVQNHKVRITRPRSWRSGFPSFCGKGFNSCIRSQRPRPSAVRLLPIGSGRLRLTSSLQDSRRGTIRNYGTACSKRPCCSPCSVLGGTG